MLCLTRYPGQDVWIGSAIRVRVLEARGPQVRLGIEAPPEFVILRQELRQEGAASTEQGSRR
jgi:carbon storage regulator